MRRENLGIEEAKAGLIKAIEQERKGDLGRVGFPMKHRLSHEHGTDGEAVNSAGQCACFDIPYFHAVRPTELVKRAEAIDEFAGDPRALFSVAASLQNARKRHIDGDRKGPLSGPTNRSRPVRALVKGEDGTRVGGAPRDGSGGHRPRENAAPVSRQERTGGKVSAETDDAMGTHPRMRVGKPIAGGRG